MNFFRATRCAAVMATLTTASLRLAPPANACQIQIVSYEASSLVGTLLDLDHKPIRDAHLVVRDTLTGPETLWGKRRGSILKELRTDARGAFGLSGLPAGTYWVTYIEENPGESFLIEIVGNGRGVRNLELVVDGTAGGSCYVLDIERNVTKPRTPGLTPFKLDAPR